MLDMRHSEKQKRYAHERTHFKMAATDFISVFLPICLSRPSSLRQLNYSIPTICFRGHTSVGMNVLYGLLLAVGPPTRLNPVSARPLEVSSSSAGCVATT